MGEYCSLGIDVCGMLKMFIRTLGLAMKLSDDGWGIEKLSFMSTESKTRMNDAT